MRRLIFRRCNTNVTKIGRLTVHRLDASTSLSLAATCALLCPSWNVLAQRAQQVRRVKSAQCVPQNFIWRRLWFFGGYPLFFGLPKFSGLLLLPIQNSPELRD